MEPLLGGKLVGPPPAIQAVWDGAAHKRTPAGWALQWLWDQPEVSTVLSGVSDLAQTMENVAPADASRIGVLSGEELALYEQARAKYRELTAIPCTGCRYSYPARITSIFRRTSPPTTMASSTTSGILPAASMAGGNTPMRCRRSMNGTSAPRSAAECGACEAKCPQRIPISKWMPVIHEVLGEGKPYVMKIETE